MNEFDNIVRIESGSEAMEWLLIDIENADKRGRDISVCFGDSPRIGQFMKIKVGEGMWSPALSVKR